MKNIINLKLASIAILLALSAMPLLAQQGRGTGRGDQQTGGQDRRPGQEQGQGQRQQMTEASVKERTTKLAETLECTDEQTKKLLEYEVAQFKKTKKERENFNGDRDAMRSYMQEQRRLSEKKYAEILTPEQLKKYQKYMEQRRQQRPGDSQQKSTDGQRSRGRGGN